MKSTVEVKSVLQRMVLLMLAGVAAGLVLTDAVNKVESTIAEIRTTYDPFSHLKMSGRSIAATLPKKCTVVCPRAVRTIRID